MTLHVDLYYTMRSPYCYLSTPQLSQLVAQYDLAFDLQGIERSAFFLYFCKAKKKFVKGWKPFLKGFKNADKNDHALH